MSHEALLTLCLLLTAALSVLNCIGYRKTEECCDRLERIVKACKSELKLHEANEANVLRKLLALKRTESRMMRTRAQMEIASKAFRSMLSRTGGKSSGDRRRGEVHNQGREE